LGNPKEGFEALNNLRATPAFPVSGISPPEISNIFDRVKTASGL
jgi:hypothetical protein